MQEVFTRLCKDDFRLLKTYDATRAGLSTWLTIVARSTARDMQRRRQPQITPIDSVPEVMLSVTAEPQEKLRLPDGLLSPRQKLVLTLLYEREMEVAEIATASIVINSIPKVLGAAPGLHTMRDLPLPSFFPGR